VSTPDITTVLLQEILELIEGIMEVLVRECNWRENGDVRTEAIPCFLPENLPDV